MATETVVLATLARLNVHCRGVRPDDEMRVLMHDWPTVLADYPNEVVIAAMETWIVVEEWFPSTADFVQVCDEESALAEAQRRNRIASSARPAVGPAVLTMDEYAAIARPHIARLREVTRAFATGVEDVRGHDHRNGAAGCPVCSKHDHSNPDWRITCPVCGQVPPDESAVLSTCRGCDGSHFIFTDHNTVKPCPECNPGVARLWREGHMELNHRCEECAPTRRARRHEDD